MAPSLVAKKKKQQQQKKNSIQEATKKNLFMVDAV